MGNLYRLNSLYELEITDFWKLSEIDKTLLERSTALEYLFLLLSLPDDFTIISDSPSMELLDHWEKNKIQFGKTIQTDNPYYTKELKLNAKFSKDTKLIEWGQTSNLIQEEGLLEKKNHLLSFSKFLNSKINQLQWKESQKYNTLTSLLCSDKLELEYVIERINFPIVLKTEFSFSGRGHIILKNISELKDFSKKIEEAFKTSKRGVIVEEWMEDRKNQDFSGLFDIIRKKSELVAITKMLIGKNGTYNGTIIQKDFGKEFEVDICKLINSFTYKSSSYKGKISLDGFTYTKENKIQSQYMSEINFRYSMGRVLYDFHKKHDEESEEYALLFFPIKNKNLTFKSIAMNLAKIETEYKSKLIITTPLENSKAKKNQFISCYVSNKKKFPVEIIDLIKKLFI